MKCGRKYLAVFVCFIGSWAILSSLSGFIIQYYNASIPSKITVISGQEETLSMGIPVVASIKQDTEIEKEREMVINLSEPITLVAEEYTTYQLELSLFGIFALKDVALEIVPEKYLIPGGINIGIYLETEGVIVADIDEVQTPQGVKSPSKYILQKGDYILAINGNPVDKKKDVLSAIEQSNGDKMIFTISRKNQIFEVKLQPVENEEGEYQLGIWVKDNAQGIGTLTYVDSAWSFGALGHGVHENETGNIVQTDMGSLYKTDIVSVKKGRSGEPGELTGVIEYNNRNVLGDIYRNESNGIFGTCNYNLKQMIGDYELVPIGYEQQITTGPAEIICSVDGERRYYQIEITEIHYDNLEKNKALELQVVDPILLEKTGGIVQGMSGSPILQDGKIVGAVTHVLVNDPTMGYGIFIENMLDAAG